MSNKSKNQIKQQIAHNLLEIMELFPQYSTVQHLLHVLRPSTGSYHWSEEELLKKFEKYRDELESDLADTISDKEED